MRTIIKFLILIFLFVGCKAKKQTFDSNQLADLIIERLVSSNVSYFGIKNAYGQKDYKLSVFTGFINIEENERLFYVVDKKQHLKLSRFSKSSHLKYDTTFSLSKIEIKNVVLEPYEHRNLETNKIDLTFYKQVLIENDYDVIVMISNPLMMNQEDSNIFYVYTSALWMKNLLTVRYKIRFQKNALEILSHTLMEN